MSVSNVLRGDDSATIVADTCTYLGGAPLTWNRKVAIYPEARLAVAVRGLRWVGRSVQTAVARYAAFGEAAEGLVEIAGTVIPAAAMKHGHPLDAGFEIALVGWEDGPRATRITYHAASGFERVERVDLSPGAHLAPSLGRHEIPGALTDEQVVKIAHLQQQVAVRHKLLMCIGGDIEAATVTADGATIRVIGSYHDKEMVEARMRRTVAGLDRSRAAA